MNIITRNLLRLYITSGQALGPIIISLFSCFQGEKNTLNMLRHVIFVALIICERFETEGDRGPGTSLTERCELSSCCALN